MMPEGELPRNSIHVIEAFFGEELTPKLAARIAAMPSNQLRTLGDHLFELSLNWTIQEMVFRAVQERDHPKKEHGPVFHHIKPHLDLDWERLERVKSLVLYFPGAVTVWEASPHDVPRTGAKRITEEVRAMVERSLKVLSELSPLVKGGDVVLVPGLVPVVADPVRSAAEDAFKARGKGIRQESDLDHQPVGDDLKPIEGPYADFLLESYLFLASILGLVPVATDAQVIEYMNDEARRLELRPASEVRIRVAGALGRFKIPALDNVPIRDVARLRHNEAAFAEFRSSFAQVLRLATDEQPRSESQFTIQLREAAEDLLRPKIGGIEAMARTSGALQQLIGGTLALGGAVVESSITKEPPVGTVYPRPRPRPHGFFIV